MASYIDLNNLGSFASINALWTAYPEGGQEGDYCTIDGVKYRWDKYDRMWVADPNFGPTPARSVTTFDGDVNMQNNLTVAGYIRAKGIKQPCLGLFLSETALTTKWPKPEVGMWAIVGDESPFIVYRCDEDGEWTNTEEETTGFDDVDLSSIVINGIKGWVAIDSISDLPSDPTEDEKSKGYLLGTTLYIWDGTEETFKSAELKGAPGPKGDPGGQLEGYRTVVNDLTTGGDEDVLSAEMGKFIGSKLGKVLNINDNEVYRLWVGTQDDFDELDGAYDDDVIYFVGTKQTATVITAITHGTQSGNTMQFTAVLDPVGSTAPVTWSVAPTPAGSATINSSGLLTISADCSVVVTAVCGNSTMSSDSVSLQYAPDPSANIVFEDANVKAALLAAMGKSADGEITYGEASEWEPSWTQQKNTFTNYKTGDNAITKFNEWKYFVNFTEVECVDNATSLVEVLFPPLPKLYSTGPRIYNIGATDLVVPCSEVGVKAVDSCSSLVSLKFTSRLATLSNGTNGAVYSCSALRTIDMSECTFTTETQSRFIQDCTNLYILKLPSSLVAMSGQILRGCSNVKYLVIGDAVNGSDIVSFATSLYNGPANLEIVLYAPYVAGQITAFATDSKAFAKLYVPDDDVDAYKADSVFSTYASKIYGISELPSGWETPPALT